jgi:(2R)-sulfolactate sulfo-lyase subunit alpha
MLIGPIFAHLLGKFKKLVDAFQPKSEFQLPHHDGLDASHETILLKFRRSNMIQFLVHEKADNVGVATVDIKTGEVAQGLYMDNQDNIEMKTLQDIPLGHKIALTDLAVENSVIKYGADIGRVVNDIKAGEHVHTHNLKTRRW